MISPLTACFLLFMKHSLLPWLHCVMYWHWKPGSSEIANQFQDRFLSPPCFPILQWFVRSLFSPSGHFTFTISDEVNVSGSDTIKSENSIYHSALYLLCYLNNSPWLGAMNQTLGFGTILFTISEPSHDLHKYFSTQQKKFSMRLLNKLRTWLIKISIFRFVYCSLILMRQFLLLSFWE